MRRNTHPLSIPPLRANPLFSKRHYDTLASILQDIDTAHGHDDKIRFTLAVVRSRFIQAFHKDNPRFDPETFVKASTRREQDENRS